MAASFAIVASAFHTPRKGELDYLDDCLIDVGEDGAIQAIVPAGDPGRAAAEAAAASAGRLVRAPEGSWLLPGMVDLHIHAPQWPQLGAALDAPLEVWLQKYTFPLEARFADLEFAREVYDSLVAALLANGTTTALYFGTIHVEACLALAEACLRRGQRALVGKVAMDNPDQCPDYYRDADAQAGIDGTHAFIERLAALQTERAPLVLPVITPRFVPSCTDALLEGLGRLAGETGAHVQTHCCESDWETAYVHERFGRTDAEVLEGFGLLREHTVLAHSNFVTAGDMDLIRAAGAGVAHCPLSNVYFADSAFPLREALDRGVRVGLGTDISGGYSPSLIEATRQAVTVSRSRESGVDAALERDARGIAGARITVAEAFWLATAGGAETLGLPVGSFEPGRQFDAMLVRPVHGQTNIALYPGRDRAADIFQKIVFNAGRSDIAAVWVAGRLCHGEVPAAG